MQLFSKFFNTASIRNRIWFGFALILFILLFISLSTLNQFMRLNDGISKVTEDIQPVVLAAQNLEINLETASSMLGFYLLTTEKSYRTKYFSQLDNANAQVKTHISFPATGTIWFAWSITQWRTPPHNVWQPKN